METIHVRINSYRRYLVDTEWNYLSFIQSVCIHPNMH